MKPTKEDWDRFAMEIMTGGRSEDMIMEKENEQLQAENTKLKQEKKELIKWLKEEIKQNDEMFYNCDRPEEIAIKGIVLEQVLERLGE